MAITATYISADSFSVAGDQTSDFQVGRRVKLTGSSTWYGTILTSVYSSVTTVTLTAASDDIDNTLTSVLYGIVSSTEASSSTPIHTHDGDEGSGGQIKAVDIPVVDSNGYYDNSTVEAIFDEIGETRIISGYDLNAPESLPDLAFSNSTRTFTASVKSGESNFYFWVDSHKFIKTTSQTVVLPDTTGTYYIYFDTSGVMQYILHSATSYALFYDDALTGLVYWNATSGVGWPGGERHGKDMPGRVHYSRHDTFGALYGSGFDITGLEDGEPTYTNTTAGHFWDEDVIHPGLLQTTHAFLYRLGADGEWYATAADNNVGFKNSTSNVVWNEWTGSTWQLTESGSSTDYMIYFKIATPSIDGYLVRDIIGQGGYSSRSNARAAIESEKESIALNGLPSTEFVWLYAYIVRRNGDLENLADGSTHIDFRATKGGAATNNNSTSVAGDVTVGITNFDGILSSTDADVQTALETIDDHTHSVTPLGSILTSTETYNGVTISVTVDDASAVFGNPLYCAADFHYERADANATGTMACSCMALESGAGTKLVLLEGQICDTDWTWTAGPIYVSGTTGAMTQTAPAVSGDQAQRIGFALSADTIYFKPDSTVIEIV